jgi:three-Cys-motif partner protein
MSRTSSYIGRKEFIAVAIPRRLPDDQPYPQHTRYKHDVLSNYLTLWGRILGSPRPGPQRILHYIDCFAGPGRYEGNYPGSPVIAMEIGQKLHEYHEKNSKGEFFLECHFVEHEKRTYEDLRWNLEIAQYDFQDVSANRYHGRFEDHLDEIFAEIYDPQPALVFLDPYRIMEIETVIRLLARRWNEILITFMSRHVNRFLSAAAQERTWDTKWRTGSWRELRDSVNRQEEIVRFYGREIQAQALEEHGIDDVLVFPIRVRDGGRKANRYHLMHVSRHPKARLAMEEAVAKADLLWQEQESFPLFSRDVEEAVLAALRGHASLGCLELAGKVWHDHWRVSWDEVKQAILDLECSGYVGVRPYKSRQRKKGLLEKDRVFLRR